MHNNKSRLTVIAVLGAAFSLAFAGVLVTSRNQPTPTTPAAAVASTATAQPAVSGGAGLVAFIDPATGQTRVPESSEILALQAAAGPAAAMSSLFAAPELIAPAAGGVGMLVDTSFDSAMVVTKGPDGKIKVHCVVGEAAANAIVTANSKVSQSKNPNDY